MMARNGQNHEEGGSSGSPIDPNEQVSPLAADTCSSFATTEHDAKSDPASGSCVECGRPVEPNRRGRPPTKTCPTHRRPPRAGKSTKTAEPLHRCDAETEELSRKLADFAPNESQDDLLPTAVEDVLRVDASGWLAEHEAHQRLRAAKDGVTTYNYVYADKARVLPMDGCTMSRERTMDRQPTMSRARKPIKANRFVQPVTIAGAPMRKGEVRWIVFKAVYVPTEDHEFPYLHMRHVPTDTLESLRMVLRVDAPAWVDVCEWTELGGEPRIVKSSQQPGTYFEFAWKAPILPGRYYGMQWRMAANPN
jgi:hypothetical protein